MKPIPAIVEKAFDEDLAAENCIVALADLRAIENKIVRVRGQLEDAIGAARMRRMELGRWLSTARAAWPERGPNAKGWGLFLARIKIPESTARSYIAEYRAPQVIADPSNNTAITPDDDQIGPRIIPAERDPGATPAPFRQMSESDLVHALARLDPEARKRVLKADKVNLQGNSGDVERGTWTTPKKWAQAIGPVDHDPFSNPRSLIASATRCMLEDGGDGFGGGRPGETPGLYLLGSEHGSRSGTADATTTVFIQPRFDMVLDAIAHYGHTRFVALLRWSPDTKWFSRLWPLVEAVCFPIGERMGFDPPPGVEEPESTIPYPHALYYRDHRDVTDAVRALCIVWQVDHTTSSALPTPAQLHLVR